MVKPNIQIVVVRGTLRHLSVDTKYLYDLQILFLFVLEGTACCPLAVLPLQVVFLNTYLTHVPYKRICSRLS